MNDENTQLTTPLGYNAKERMIFSDVISGNIPDSKPKIEFKRINISTRNNDGTVGELILPTERLYSFGVSENTSQETGKVTGYTFPLCMWGKDIPTEAEQIWTNTFDNIVDQCIAYLINNKEDIDLFDLTTTDLTKSKGGLNPMYWKKEKATDPVTGKLVLRKVPDKGPTLYAKLIYSKKNDKFLTQFYDTNDNPIDARELMGKHCHATGAVKIESIFIGSKISLQVKLYESVVEVPKSGMKRLLRPTSDSIVKVNSNQDNVGSVLDDDDDDDDDDKGSLIGEDVTPHNIPIDEPKKEVIRKIVKKTIKRST